MYTVSELLFMTRITIFGEMWVKRKQEAKFSSDFLFEYKKKAKWSRATIDKNFKFGAYNSYVKGKQDK